MQETIIIKTVHLEHQDRTIELTNPKLRKLLLGWGDVITKERIGKEGVTEKVLELKLQANIELQETTLGKNILDIYLIKKFLGIRHETLLAYYRAQIEDLIIFKM